MWEVARAAYPDSSGVPPGEQTWQDPDGSGQVGHATDGGTLTLRPCGATNEACEIGGVLGAPAAGRPVPAAFIGSPSFAGSRESALQEILEVRDHPSPGGNLCGDEIFLGEEP